MVNKKYTKHKKSESVSYWMVIVSLFLSLVKAFFNAVVSIAWGIATFFLLIALMNYYKVDISTVKGLFDIVFFVQQNWGWFFVCIFFYDWLISAPELFKALKNMKKEVK